MLLCLKVYISFFDVLNPQGVVLCPVTLQVSSLVLYIKNTSYVSLCVMRRKQSYVSTSIVDIDVD